jgi:soluble lytic murein transglycosylase
MKIIGSKEKTLKALAIIIGMLLMTSFLLPLNYNNLLPSPRTSNVNKILLFEAPIEVRIAEQKKESHFIRNAVPLILKHNPKLSYSIANKIARAIYRNSVLYGYDPYLILSIIKVESSFDPDAVSSVGAMGLMQLMPDVGIYLAEQKGIKIKDTNQLFDINLNIRLGVYYLRFLHRYYHNIKMALLAYNMGPGNLNYFINKGKLPDNDYHRMVLKFYSKVKNIPRNF